MTPASVAARVVKIDRASADDEHAHALEDALYLAVLREIARGKRTPADCVLMSREAIKAHDISFARWRS